MRDELKDAISIAYRMDEMLCLKPLLEEASPPLALIEKIESRAKDLITKTLQSRLHKNNLDAFLKVYDLSTEEGIALMRLAECLLRVPDQKTRGRLIKDKIANRNWQLHYNNQYPLLVNATTKALFYTEKLLSNDPDNVGIIQSVRKQFNNISLPLISVVALKAMKLLGNQFVLAETIASALKKAKTLEAEGYRYSYDMLGEAAKTAEDAQFYFEAYQKAIQSIRSLGEGHPIYSAGISVKLSALHPRYEWNQRKRVIIELYPKLKSLALQAKKANIGFTIDAEEADRLDLSLLLLEKLMLEFDLKNWQGLGLAVQAYQKRASFVLDWLIALARNNKRRLMVRLVKGAYWDSEIKWAQEKGLRDYPVFTRKSSTDVSYLACARKMLKATDAIYPQFATHNAYTVAYILEIANGYRDFEFQCLHGMGKSLYDHIVAKEGINIPCRIYAPVGGYQYLLAYLVRRLLENGSNTSFVNQLINGHTAIEELIQSPMKLTNNLKLTRHPNIPMPKFLYGEERENSMGIDLSNEKEVEPLLNEVNQYIPTLFDTPLPTLSIAEVDKLLEKLSYASFDWDNTPVEKRAEIIERLANMLEKNKAELMALLIREGGKTFQDALSEMREAIDFCRYYSVKAREDFKEKILKGPTGEMNIYSLHGRGVILCISPWNFPLAIFLSQVIAALLAGNSVVAKPSSLTPYIALKAIALMHDAGVPREVLQLLIGRSDQLSEPLLADQRIKGVMLTGSSTTAENINQKLAFRKGALLPFIAETGGQNAMIVDSSALPEQVVNDVIASAFNSAGQRCSALRVLFIQEEVANHIIKMLKGAMAELIIGDPLDLSTDIGPVIDQNAVNTLKSHIEYLDEIGRLVYTCSLPNDQPNLPKGKFFAPCAYEISDIRVLKKEVFGPILHIIRYQERDLMDVIQSINRTGYGLTLGIHSRIDEKIDYIRKHVKVGNLYVNRNMIGAVVGVQPFGGEGLSGTGPKAGGPYILSRLAVERSVSINTTASGGNVTLMSLKE